MKNRGPKTDLRAPHCLEPVDEGETSRRDLGPWESSALKANEGRVSRREGSRASVLLISHGRWQLRTDDGNGQPDSTAGFDKCCYIGNLETKTWLEWAWNRMRREVEVRVWVLLRRGARRWRGSRMECGGVLFVLGYMPIKMIQRKNGKWFSNVNSYSYFICFIIYVV